jgi:hypothetical protein
MVVYEKDPITFQMNQFSRKRSEKFTIAARRKNVKIAKLIKLNQ